VREPTPALARARACARIAVTPVRRGGGGGGEAVRNVPYTFYTTILYIYVLRRYRAFALRTNRCRSVVLRISAAKTFEPDCGETAGGRCFYSSIVGTVLRVEVEHKTPVFQNARRRRPESEHSVWRVEAHARRVRLSTGAGGRSKRCPPEPSVRPSVRRWSPVGHVSSGAVAVAAVTLKRGRTGAAACLRYAFFSYFFYFVSNAANDLNRCAREVENFYYTRFIKYSTLFAWVAYAVQKYFNLETGK